MAIDARQFLMGMAKLDHVIAAFKHTTYQNSYESELMNRLKDARTLLTSACVPGQYKPERELDLHD